MVAAVKTRAQGPAFRAAVSAFGGQFETTYGPAALGLSLLTGGERRPSHSPSNPALG
jgi:hypothetical protein